MLSCNMFAYCRNNPVNMSDESGQWPKWLKSVTKVIKKAAKKVKKVVTSFYKKCLNTIDTAVSAFGEIAASTSKYIQKELKSSVAPKNIGKGTWQKTMTKQINEVIESEAKISKACKGAGYAIAVVDICTGIYDNIKVGASTSKIRNDAVVDSAFTFGGMAAAGFLGGKIGAIAGSYFPIAGNIVGGIAGIVIGVGIYGVTECVEWRGKSFKDYAKDGANYLF